MSYKNILTGINTFSDHWLSSIKTIQKENIIIFDFEDYENLQNIIILKKIDYIIPLSEKDFLTITNYKKYDNKIIYPATETINILHNKLLFTKFMLEHFYDYIPTTYYLDDIELCEIEYPAISKPIYSTNGQNMVIIYSDSHLLWFKNKLIIQKFIKEQYEFGAFMFCINGKIINWKIIKSKYADFTIKKQNFPPNYEIVENIDISIFERIIAKLNYSGGINFDFKFNHSSNKINIFEINPRFGGSAFTLNFIYELLCIT